MVLASSSQSCPDFKIQILPFPAPSWEVEFRQGSLLTVVPTLDNTARCVTGTQRAAHPTHSNAFCCQLCVLFFSLPFLLPFLSPSLLSLFLSCTPQAHSSNLIQEDLPLRVKMCPVPWSGRLFLEGMTYFFSPGIADFTVKILLPQGDLWVEFKVITVSGNPLWFALLAGRKGDGGRGAAGPQVEHGEDRTEICMLFRD